MSAEEKLLDPAGNPTVELRDVSKRYQSGELVVDALRGLTLRWASHRLIEHSTSPR